MTKLAAGISVPEKGKDKLEVSVRKGTLSKIKLERVSNAKCNWTTEHVSQQRPWPGLPTCVGRAKTSSPQKNLMRTMCVHLSKTRWSKLAIAGLSPQLLSLVGQTEIHSEREEIQVGEKWRGTIHESSRTELRCSIKSKQSRRNSLRWASSFFSLHQNLRLTIDFCPIALYHF